MAIRPKVVDMARQAMGKYNPGIEIDGQDNQYQTPTLNFLKEHRGEYDADDWMKLFWASFQRAYKYNQDFCSGGLPERSSGTYDRTYGYMNDAMKYFGEALHAGWVNPVDEDRRLEQSLALAEHLLRAVNFDKVTPQDLDIDDHEPFVVIP